MEKHLILVDLDGTLLNKESKISELNKETLSKLRALGHEVIIVTGRAHYRSHMYYEELGLDSVFVNRNGSHIHRPNDDNFNEILEYISQDAYNKLFSGQISHCIDRLYYENKNTIYVVKGDIDFYRYELCHIVNGETSDAINLISLHVYKDYVEEVNNIIKSIDDLYYEVYNSEQYETALFQIYPNCDKANSIQFLSDYYHVPKQNIIAFGDGINDIRMIKEAGIGIAVANAIDEVKSVAKIILDKTNDESAVGEFLIHYFNL